MRIRTIPFHLIIFLLLSSHTLPAIACPPPDCGDCCHWEGPVPGGSCELNTGAECGDCCGCSGECESCNYCSCEDDNSQCTGECHDGCSGGDCVDDNSQCTGECHDGCSGGSCVDDNSQCTGECHNGCSDGDCVDDDSQCTGECHDGCDGGDCVDDDTQCHVCEECNGGDCELKPTSECINDEWRPNPTPTATIQSTNGEKWDHINDTADSIPLGLSNPEDKDDKCVDCLWETQPDNYIEEDDTEWEWSAGEGYCSPTTGATTNWYATSTAQPTWVKAKLIDSSTDPDPDADDDDEWTDTYTDLHGFKVGVRANFNGVWEGNSGTIWEGGSYSYSTATSGEINAWNSGVTKPGSDEEADYFYVSFEYKTQPSDADPAGNVKADLEFGLDADWQGYVSDCDIVDQGASVSIGFSPGAFGIGGSFSYTWDLDDGQEGMASGDWAYMTNEGLGTQRTPSGDPLFVYESGDCPDIPPQICWFNYDAVLHRSATKEWEKGDQVKGQYDISCASYATPHCSLDVGRSDGFMTNPVVKIDNVEYSP